MALIQYVAGDDFELLIFLPPSEAEITRIQHHTLSMW